MKYYVENWETEEVIAVFETSQERQEYINSNAPEGFLEDGTKVSVYEGP